MYGELSSEVIHCPNCNEDVPKTLYCLNCGYPLYKIEQEQKISREIEPEPEIPEPVPEETEVDMSVEIEQQPEIPELLEEIETTIEVEEQDEAMEVEVEPEYEETPEEIVTETATEESLEETETSEEDAEETFMVEEEIISHEVSEPPAEEETAPEPGVYYPEPQGYEEPPTVPVTTEPAQIDQEGEETTMEELSIDFTPDPMTREVMENLAKNITLKIRLVRLLKDGQVKEETFKKLFDSYVDQGKIWISRREENLRRFKSDTERMEENLVTSRKDYELLEIRRSIGDTDEKEYEVKAPAYKWDIEHLEKEIKNRRAGVAYISNLKKLVPEEEIEELKQLSNTDYSILDEIDGVTEDTITKIKETLSEAYNNLNN